MDKELKIKSGNIFTKRLTAFIPYYLAFAFVFSILNPNLFKIPIPYLNFFELLTIPLVISFLPFLVFTRVGGSESLLYISILIIIFSRVLSLVFAPNLRFDQLISIFRYIEYLVVIYIVGYILNNEGSINSFVKGVIFFVLIETVAGAIWFFLGLGRGYFFTNGIYLQQVFIILIAILNLTCNSYRNNSLWYFLMFGMIIGIIMAQIRIGYIDLLISLILLTIITKAKIVKNKKITLILIMGSIILLLLSFTSYAEPIKIRIQQAIRGEGTVWIRMLLWNLAWQVFLTHPITGIGTGGFARFQSEYLDSLGLYLPEEYLGLSTHNTILGILAETGIVGFMAYMIYAIVVIKLSELLIKYSNITTNCCSKNISITVSICLILTIFMDWFAQGSFGPGASLLLGLAVGTLRNVKIGRRSNNYELNIK